MAIYTTQDWERVKRVDRTSAPCFARLVSVSDTQMVFHLDGLEDPTTTPAALWGCPETVVYDEYVYRWVEAELYGGDQKSGWLVMDPGIVDRELIVKFYDTPLEAPVHM